MSRKTVSRACKDFLTRLVEEFSPFNRLLGFRLEHAEAGRAVVRVPRAEQLVGNPFLPAVHGGVLSTLIDMAGGVACFTVTSDPDLSVGTIDLRVDFLRPAPVADLLCEAVVARMGDRIAVVRMEVFEATARGPRPNRRKPIALGQAAYSLNRRRDPDGGKQPSGKPLASPA